MKRPGLAFCAFLLLTSPALLAQASFQRVDERVAKGRFTDAAADLKKIAEKAGPEPQPPATDEEKALREVIQGARAALNDQGVRGRQRSAARRVLCMARAWFPDEDLEGLESAPRVGAQRPTLIDKIAPRYTDTARRAKIAGVAIVDVLIDQEGCVRHPRVKKGLPMGLDAAALAAVRNWTFEPATFEGRPVAVHYTLTVNFEPPGGEAGVGDVKFRRDGEERPTITNRLPG
jgi:TonB family protein